MVTDEALMKVLRDVTASGFATGALAKLLRTDDPVALVRGYLDEYEYQQFPAWTALWNSALETFTSS